MHIIFQALSDGFPLIFIGMFVFVYCRHRFIKTHDCSESNNSKWHVVLLFLFVLYLLTLASVTLIPHWRYALTAAGTRKITFYIENEKTHINLIPFKSIDKFLYGNDSGVDNFRSTGILNVMGNAAIFFPFGFLGILLFHSKRHIVPLLLFAGITASLLIEVVQYFIGRSSDIDDIILNTIGLILGLLAGKLILRIFPKTKDYF